MEPRQADYFGSGIDAWVGSGGHLAPVGGRTVLLDLTTMPGEAKVEGTANLEAWGVERWERVDGSDAPNLVCNCRKVGSEGERVFLCPIVERKA
jgi:hypothetical protein